MDRVRYLTHSSVTDLYEVLEAPGNDGVVVNCHVEGHHCAGQAQAAQVRTHLFKGKFDKIFIY